MIIYSRVLVLEILFSVVFKGFKRYSDQTLYLLKKFLKIEMQSRSLEGILTPQESSNNNNRGFSRTVLALHVYTITDY